MPRKRAEQWLCEGRGAQSSAPAVTEGWLGAHQVSQPQFAHCQDRNHHSHWIYFRDVSESIIKYASYKHFPLKFQKIVVLLWRILVTCFPASPVLYLGLEQALKSLKRDLQYPYFCVSTCPWVCSTPPLPFLLIRHKCDTLMWVEFDWEMSYCLYCHHRAL